MASKLLRPRVAAIPLKTWSIPTRTANEICAIRPVAFRQYQSGLPTCRKYSAVASPKVSDANVKHIGSKSSSVVSRAERSQTPGKNGKLDTDTFPRPATVEDFEKLLKSGGRRVTFDDARACLRDTRARLEALPTTERREQAAKAGASRILAWIRGRRLNVQASNVNVNVQLCENLCWFLHAEGSKSLVWDWVKEEHDLAEEQAHDTEDQRGQDMFWVSCLLTGLVRADLTWAPENSPNEAIKTLQDMFALYKDSRKISLVKPATSVAIAIHRGQYPPIDLDLFEWFVSSHRDYTLNERDQKKLDIARAMLFHPTTPKPEEFAGVFPHFNESPETYGIRTSHFRAMNSIGNSGLQCAYLFRLKGDNERAMAMEDIVKEKHDFVWARRDKMYEYFERMPALANVRENAAASTV